MKTLLKLASVLASVAVSGVALPVLAVERSESEEAIALVERAEMYIQKHGLEKAIAEFNRLDSPFNVRSEINPKGDLYMFMFWANKGGVQLVHGKNPKIVGKDVIDMRDADGLPIIREIIRVCNAGHGWAYYKWPNPLTKEIEAKQSWVIKVDQVCIGTGIYKPK